MDELQKWYLGNLPERIQKIEKSFATFDFQNPETTKALLGMVHSLRGSGATYGFPLISEKAAVVEEATDEDNFRRTLEDFIHTLKQCANQLQDSRAKILLLTFDPEIASQITAHAKASSRIFLKCHSAD